VRIVLPPPAWLRGACLFAFACVLVQLFFLAEPPLVKDLHDLLWDKLLHATAFGSFAMLLWFGIGFRASVVSWIAITVVGALDEFHQIFVPGRSADIFDVLADTIGAALVTYILHRLSHSRKEKAHRGQSAGSRTGQARALVSRAD
jgi:VanZ family protein